MRQFLQLWFFVILLICFWFNLLVSGSQILNGDDGLSFLITYGYLKNDELSSKYRNDINLAMHQGLTDFQKFYHLPESGILDSSTLLMMNQPRCSNPERMDITRNSDMSRSMTRSRGWTYSMLRYSILNSPPSQEPQRSQRFLERDVQNAFRMWEEVANISLVRVGWWEEAEIKITFVEGNHNDNMPFGERAMGFAVAHAFFPTRHDGRDHHHHELEGDIHLDNSRAWTFTGDNNDNNAASGTEKVNFFQVCVHEIGHALGLEHSMEENAVMHMLINPRDDFHLHEDDIRGIRNLYGPRVIDFESQVVSPNHNNHVNYNDKDSNPLNDLSNTNLPNHKNYYAQQISHTQKELHRYSNMQKNIWFIKSYKKTIQFRSEK